MRSAFLPSVQACLVLLLLLSGQGGCWKCPVSQTVCEIWLELEHYATMMKGKTLVVAKDGLLFPYNVANFSQTHLAVHKEDVSIMYTYI